MSNPWLVDEMEDFWFLNCPECAFKTKIQNDFQKHAVGNHTLSLVLFSDDILNAATIKEEIGTDDLCLEGGSSNKLQHLDVKCEPDDCLMTDDPTLGEIMYPNFEEDAPDMSSIISTKKSCINIQKVSKEHKRESKIQFKNLVVKQCTEELISPARLAVIHKVDRDTIKRWVKNSGKKLPAKYVLQQEGKSNIGHRDCNQCGQTFFGSHSKRDLATHMKKHEVKLMKQFICQFCNVEYKSKFSMNRHENKCPKKKQQV
jgi:hypothetical protein